MKHSMYAKTNLGRGIDRIGELYIRKIGEGLADHLRTSLRMQCEDQLHPNVIAEIKFRAIIVERNIVHLNNEMTYSAMKHAK